MDRIDEIRTAEDAALAAIADRCQSTDYEGNGSQLDMIVDAFLRRIGCERLARAANSVECWRA